MSNTELLKRYKEITGCDLLFIHLEVDDKGFKVLLVITKSLRVQKYYFTPDGYIICAEGMMTQIDLDDMSEFFEEDKNEV